MPKRSPSRTAFALMLNFVAPPLILAVAWGRFADFFANPARVVATLLFELPTLVMVAYTSGFAAHERRSDESPKFLAAINIASNLSLVITVYLEGHGIWVMPGGDLARWIGVAILAAGTWLRAATMIELGSRFSLTVSAQAGHELETTGLYARVRHPSYLGAILISVGVAGAFRSWFWLALIPFMVYGVVRRMDTEERFLTDQFGDQYRSYVARTARLVPGVY
jgi:protein-S-isoprenylcysteine O-methyltransferase Ste14